MQILAVKRIWISTFMKSCKMLPNNHQVTTIEARSVFLFFLSAGSFETGGPPEKRDPRPPRRGGRAGELRLRLRPCSKGLAARATGE